MRCRIPEGRPDKQSVPKGGRFVLLVVAAVLAPGTPRSSASPAPHPKRSAAAEPPAGYVALASAPPQQTALALPFTGVWGVIQGMSSQGTHQGYAAYALDFVPAEPPVSEKTFRQRKRLDQHPCYGRPILAPADGRVVWARDGERELPPFRESKRHQAGNFIILQHTPDEFTEFRHLQRGSLTVKLGDSVQLGQVIGRCGNSGNAGTPHLHFAFLGSYRPIATRPVRLSHYEVMTGPNVWQPGDGEPKQGQILRPVPALPQVAH